MLINKIVNIDSNTNYFALKNGEDPERYLAIAEVSISQVIGNFRCCISEFNEGQIDADGRVLKILLV